MAKFFMRPLEVEAVMFSGETVGDRNAEGMVIADTAPAWFTPHTTDRLSSDISVPLPHGDIMQTGDSRLLVGIHGRTQIAEPGDYLVRHADGSIFVEKPDVFFAMYALPLDIVSGLEDAYMTDAVKPKSMFGRLFERAAAILKGEQEKLF